MGIVLWYSGETQAWRLLFYQRLRSEAYGDDRYTEHFPDRVY